MTAHHNANAIQPQRHERSLALHERALQFLPGGTSRSVQDTQPHPIYASHGQGLHVYDVDGNRYADFYGNASSLVHGHAHPRILEAAVDRVKKGTVFSLAGADQIDLAEMICSRVRSIDKVRFVNSGTEAVMMGMKLMRAFSGRPMIAKFEGMYHGTTDWAEVSMRSSPDNWGSQDAPASVPYTPGVSAGVLEDTLVLPFNDIDRTAALLERHHDKLAGVMLDVLPVRLALADAKREFVQRLRSITRDLGLLLGSDEVVTFRLGYGGAQEYFGFDADVTMLGKVIGGGFPVGAVGGREDIMALMDASKGKAVVPHAGTFNGNPVTMAAGVRALQMLDRAAIERINALGHRLRCGLHRAFTEMQASAHVAGIGSFFQITMTQDRPDDYRAFWAMIGGNSLTASRQSRFYNALLRRGILLTLSGAGTIATVMTETDVDTFICAAADAVTEVEARQAVEPARAT